MYILEYCDNPEIGELLDGQRSYEDSLSDEYCNHLRALDRFVYLIDMFRIIKSCSSDLHDLPRGDAVEFWKINKALINYLNAVYSYKEYVNCYNPPLKEVADEYYYDRKWYRFICDYRNRVIHQSTIIKDRSTSTGDIYIDLDEVIAIQRAVIADLEEKRRKCSDEQRKYKCQIKNAERFLQELSSFMPSPTLITREGKKYQSMKAIAVEADKEIASLNDEILKHAYSKGVLPSLKWLLSLVYKDDGGFRYTFLVNKALIGISAKMSVFCYEPTYSIESFFGNMLKCLGKENPVCKSILDWLCEEGYQHSFELGCPITEFYEREWAHN